MKKPPLIILCVLLCGLCLGFTAEDRDKDPICDNEPEGLPDAVTTSEFCADAFAGRSAIPVGDFEAEHTFPLTPIYVTQDYNNSAGHNGLDLGGTCSGSYVGKERITNVLDGVVLVSYGHRDTHGWGEAVCVASRASRYSEEIITHCYHHLDLNKRFSEACDVLSPGDLVGMEGETGYNDGGAHLHHGVRRWKNLAALRAAVGFREVEGVSRLDNVINLFGTNGEGYGDKDGAHLAGHLEPSGFLSHSFMDYMLDDDGNAPWYSWSLPFVLKMRKLGVEFGLFDGRYGAGETVLRREAARWIKIAARQQSASDVVPFLDVPNSDSDYPYVQAMARYPSYEPVINPDHSCIISAGQYFCPDDEVNRAEALKMVILGFYSENYLTLYNNVFWRGSLVLIAPLLSEFQDVAPDDWFAPYVYYGVVAGLVAQNEYFNPGDSISREELAKWIITGYEYRNGSLPFECSDVICPDNNYCDPNTGDCHEIPSCIPSLGVECPIGGGIEGPCDNPECSPGEEKEQDCGIGGTQTATCSEECQWGLWGDCIGSGSCTPGATQPCGNCGTMTCDGAGEWGSCLGQGVCSPGSIQQQVCNAVGIQSRTCTSYCTWGAWGTCSAECIPGQIQEMSCGGGTGTMERVCDGSGQWGSWGVCVPNCEDEYLADASSQCYDNPLSSGSPTLCLYVQQNSGSSWKYQICKDGGSFLNAFTYKLKDENHGVVFTQYSDSATTCTDWRNFDVSYIPDYGASNGAGVMGHVTSPSGCLPASCQYTTGMITIRRECN